MVIKRIGSRIFVLKGFPQANRGRCGKVGEGRKNVKKS